MTDFIWHTFEEALAAAEAFHKRRHLLLGNGFSIACRPDCFSYRRLLDEADLTALSVEGLDLFSNEDTADFEAVIRSLRAAARMADFYVTTDPELSRRLHADAECLKEILADTLAKKHPDNVGEIEVHEYESARRFLSHFERFYTVNYDLLLYWAVLQELEPGFAHDDGFRADPDDVDAEWVAWNSYNQYGQNVFFMHGGLHLYDDGATLRKLTFSRTGIPLIEQIRAQLDVGAFPLVVTEGTAEEKLAGVLSHAYLGKCLRSLSSCVGSLFIHGHSLAENDEHILRAIVESKFKAAFVSLHGDPEVDANREIRERAGALALWRPEKKPLSVKFYDADSATVWN
jgi:Domain of unknown function (DUF4917)